MSLRDASQFLDELGVQRSHVAVHEWVHKANLQPISTVTADQLAVDEKMIHLNGQDHWLYGAVDPRTNKILHLSLFPTTTKQTTHGFSTSCTAVTNLTMCCFPLMTLIISDQCSPKTDTDSR